MGPGKGVRDRQARQEPGARDILSPTRPGRRTACVYLSFDSSARSSSRSPNLR